MVLWFTGRPERGKEKAGRNGIGTFYELRSTPVGIDIIKRLRGYSLLGVKYFVVPKGFSITPEDSAYFDIKKIDGSPLFPLLYYDEEIRIYENPYALKRAYMVYIFEYADS